MKSANLPAQSQRVSEVGLVWEEKLSGATGTLRVQRHTTFRVRATGATTVTIDGVLAATMSTGEIMLFNTGIGDPADEKFVDIVIGAVAAFVQVAREIDRKI